MVALGKDEENLLGKLTPQELHDKIQKIVGEQQNKVQDIYIDILEELGQNNVFIINEKQLSEKQGSFCSR